MIQSMTGFGRATLVLPNKKISVEVRSLNSKHVDLSIRIPSYYKEKELDLRSFLSSTLRRGKIELSIFVEQTGATSQHKINADLVSAHMKSLQDIAASPIDEPTLLSMAMRLPEVMKAEREEFNKKEWSAVMTVVKDAVKALQDYRIAEGLSLEKDLRSHVARIEELHQMVPQYEQERIDNIKERIQAKLKELTNIEFNEERLEQEMIYFIEKLDLSEEKVRLNNHCDYFIQTLEEHEANGKKLGFISQELGREINTMGSKANHAELQKLVVEMKDALEKIKEQVLNAL